MPEYLFNVTTLKAIWPIILTAVLLAWGASLFVDKEKRKEVFLVMLTFSMMGIVTGYLTGLSSEPAVGAVVPALLSLMGGLLLMIASKSEKNSKEEIKTRLFIISIGVFIFSLTFLLGAHWGGTTRAIGMFKLEEYSKREKSKLEEYIKSEEYLIWHSCVEFKVNEYRKSLGLPTPEANKDSINQEVIDACRRQH